MGSEMCIRDSPKPSSNFGELAGAAASGALGGALLGEIALTSAGLTLTGELVADAAAAGAALLGGLGLYAATRPDEVRAVHARDDRALTPLPTPRAFPTSARPRASTRRPPAPFFNPAFVRRPLPHSPSPRCARRRASSRARWAVAWPTCRRRTSTSQRRRSSTPSCRRSARPSQRSRRCAPHAPRARAATRAEPRARAHFAPHAAADGGRGEGGAGQRAPWHRAARAADGRQDRLAARGAQTGGGERGSGRGCFAQAARCPQNQSALPRRAHGRRRVTGRCARVCWPSGWRSTRGSRPTIRAGGDHDPAAGGACAR